MEPSKGSLGHEGPTLRKGLGHYYRSGQRRDSFGALSFSRSCPGCFPPCWYSVRRPSIYDLPASKTEPKSISISSHLSRLWYSIIAAENGLRHSKNSHSFRSPVPGAWGQRPNLFYHTSLHCSTSPVPTGVPFTFQISYLFQVWLLRNPKLVGNLNDMSDSMYKTWFSQIFSSRADTKIQYSVQLYSKDPRERACGE